MKAILKAFFSLCGYEVRRIPSGSKKQKIGESNDHIAIIKQLVSVHGPAIIVDAGAHTGEMTAYYRASFDNVSIHAFEPLPDLHESLQRRFNNDICIKLNRTVLAEHNGLAEFTRTSFSPASSLLTPSERGNRIWGESVFDVAEKLQVGSTTLDTYVAENDIANITLLKLDVQVQRRRSSQCATATLSSKKISSIYIELTNIGTYYGQPRIAELISCLEEHGLELHSIHNVDCGPNGFIRQFDALFFSVEIRKNLGGRP